VTQSPATKKDVSAIGKAIRTLGGAAGGAMGSYFGQPMVGGALGTSLGAALSKWLGAGDYTVSNNTIVKQSMRAAGPIPSMHNDGQTVVIRHREYLGEVKSSQTYTVQQSYPINPGMGTTFPWLSEIANSFQEYKIRGLVYHYIPTSGIMGSTTSPSLGSVMLQTSYRSTDSAPASKVELLNEFWSNEVVPSETMAHPIECDPKENPFNVQYIRSGPVPAGETQLMYGLGQTHLAVSGCQVDGKVLGDLWITYEIELKKPLVASNVTSRIETGFLSTTTGVSPNTPMGSGTFTGTVPAEQTVAGPNTTITFPIGTVGTFSVFCVADGSFTATSPTFAYTSCVAGSSYNAATSTFFATSSGALWLGFGVRISDPSTVATVTYTFAGATGTAAIGRTRIVRIA
jgi:hypothetical protein